MNNANKAVNTDALRRPRARALHPQVAGYLDVRRHSMPLAARLNSPLALFGKLEREAYRSFHAKTPLHKADHFFNFCITAASMRDYVLEHLQKISSQDAKPYYDSWAKVPALVGAAEIANSAKHFVLREKRTGQTKTVQTRGVGTTKAGFIDVYASPDGDVKLVETWRSEITVTLSDGQVLQLYKFTEEVLRYWKDFLKSVGLKVRRQPFAQLVGSDV